MKAGYWALVAGVAAVLLVGCGGGSETAETRAEGSAKQARSGSHRKLREIYVTLDSREGAENVGILMAERLGYFNKVGLAVYVITPATPNRPILYVDNETDVFGVSHEPEVALAREKGVPVVAVGSLIAQPTAAMIWLKKSHIHGIADLKGKTIAIPGLPFQKSFLRSVLARAGVALKDVKVKSVGDKLVPALADGRADAIFGGSANIEGVKLESLGLKPIITPIQDLGIPAYEELVVITKADRAAKEPKLVRDFMWAVRRGTAAAIEDPEAAVDVIEEGDEKDLEVDRKVTEAEAEATFPLLSRSGHISTDRAKHLVDWMYEQGMVQRRLPVSTLLANGR